MEQKHYCASVCEGLPTLSAYHPWWGDQNLELEDSKTDHIVYTTRDTLSQHKCRIPFGRYIKGCFYGWVILSNHPHNDIWSLWHPVTSKVIRLPRLITKSEDLKECCLSTPPGYYASIFMLTTKQYTIVFCRLDDKRMRRKWVEMSYATQMRSITGGNNGYICSLTCCNGKVYAMINTVPSKLLLIRINIVVNGGEVVISLLQYMKLPSSYMTGLRVICFLKGCCTELFYIGIGLNSAGHVTKETVGSVNVFKLHMKDMKWEEMKDLNDIAFFLDFAHGLSVLYSPAVLTSELGGYVHFLESSGKVIHSYDYKNKTIALSSMPTSHASLIKRRIHNAHGKIKCEGETQQEEGREKSCFLDLPFDVLKTIIDLFVGVEYLNFRATCKEFHIAAPMIRWGKGGRLRTCSLVSRSPWLMVLHKDEGVISFVDPMSGEKYFIKTPPELIGVLEIYSSMFGWLLIRRREGPLMFFNPFTGDIRVLPFVLWLDTFCFFAPPTSSDCMVIGFTTRSPWHVYVHLLGQEPSWRSFQLNYYGDDLHLFHFATPYGQNRFALYNNGRLDFIETNNQHYTWRKVLAKYPRSSCGYIKQSFLMKCESGSTKQNFLLRCDHQLLLVIVGEFGECVEVFKLNNSMEWEQTESLGKHAIYISGKVCLCVEAKSPEMANKIYFPRLHMGSGKVVFYSLETRRYHTFGGQDMEESFGDFMGTKHHVDPHVWIEPSWS